MTDSLLHYCQTLRSDTFVHGFLPEWIQVRGPVIELTLPFYAETEARKLIATDDFLNAYTWHIHGKVEALPRKTDAKAVSSRNIIAVTSGKGGVGKSSVTVSLALALQASGARVGILDADIFGPSIPTMLGNKQAKPEFTEDKKMLPIERFGLQVNSLGYLTDEEDATVWRGPMASRALEQLCFDTRWHNLDYLLIDMPPGTGDIQLTLAQKLPVTGAVIVTTPQEVALADAQKGIAMFRKVGVPVFGLVENMSYYSCGACQHKDYIFGRDGGKNLAERHSIPLLGEWPLVTDMREHLDAGTPLVQSSPEHPVSQEIITTAERMAANAWQLSSPNAPND
ncbi:iron-sulfur cluster carrier protein ApbC [Aliidiomarina taiwanensis]|uniref:Iron-sulfur cluster carrier protein n=1 Tax=Aliidiomarina taiwanensis TaxID=946228 RepID=A0A432X9J8_9GAMM|nr:iron-sulfur cluster carrier protein ApbC [Aliidiomarina taiwanensis]RUO44068.1 iron-sulfur cluster carrier protein ApbC [Aliidiomarina taiwanensis]